ncbi:MAG: glucose-6-phosphate dehydrogenase [Coriobacteriia bacterium]|nr:glucose-6-phosphate dehydrogenase [Coriobacteriia bacterium]
MDMWIQVAGATGKPRPTVLVVFGATGDLMARKIAPALHHLWTEDRLPSRFEVVGFSRRDWSDDQLREHVSGILRQRFHAADESFLGMFRYHRGTFEDDAAYGRLADDLRRRDDEAGECANKLFYLAVPPEHYRVILGRLASSGLTRPCSDEEGWTRVLVEKPFGKDVATSRELDELLGSLFAEEQVYRIDHYLAKEMLQGILSFRFSNNLFEPSWTAEAVERIDITLLEEIGVEGRAGFYDGVGALRDVGQNHLLQMLALVTMDRPRVMDASSIRARRAEALRRLPRLSPQQAAASSFRAQYEGYRGIERVDPHSTTETYFKLRTTLRDPRWDGVPFTLESGKRLPEVRKRIDVTFRHPQPCLCPPDGRHVRNRVSFTLEPEEGIHIGFWAKRPGLELRLEERRFDFLLYEQGRAPYVEEYAKLLLDAVLGDQTLFVSTEEVRAMWGFIDPFLRAWAEDLTPLASYEPGSAAILEQADRSVEGRAPLVQAQGVRREIAVIGLGKMGSGIARNLLDHGWRVVGWNRTHAVAEGMAAEGLEPARTFAEAVRALTPPRVVWMMLPAGAVTEEALLGEAGVARLLEPGDVLVDGGNSFHADTAARARGIVELGVDFLDCGTSGGPAGARNGACLMIGGRREAFERLRPLWEDLTVPGGFAFFEGHGAGHFVKMVHNGIEYGMMQSVAEGFAILRASPYGIDLLSAAEVYAHGSVIESRLLGWLRGAYETWGTELEGVSGVVGRTGEGEWTVRAAEELGVPAPVIARSLRFRVESEAAPSYAGRVLSALRSMFGGHAAEREAQVEAAARGRT